MTSAAQPGAPADAIAASSALNGAPRRLEFGIGAHRSSALVWLVSEKPEGGARKAASGRIQSGFFARACLMASDTIRFAVSKSMR